jgi:fructoselysine-6-P-deglycase FrlB-like protein
MSGPERRFLAEIHEQPAALEALLGHLDEFEAAGRACVERAPSVVRLVGHGSSDGTRSRSASTTAPTWTSRARS